MKKEEEKQLDDNQKQEQSSKQLMLIGTELTIPIIVFALLGYWIDLEYNTKPTWMIIGLFTGLIVGTYNFWKIIRKLNK